tara:strand:+ start:241 stop:441 length:201 start_codon:yes stop_codon:yes gene_type:complete
MTYEDIYNDLFGDPQFDFGTIIKEYLISYLLDWSPRWDPSGTDKVSFMESLLTETNIPELDPPEQD